MSSQAAALAEAKSGGNPAFTTRETNPVKRSDLDEVTALVLGRSKQAHHGIEDVEIKDLESEAARSWAGPWP